MNESVNKTYRFISERRNPYLTLRYVKLHHLTTGQCVNETDSKKLLEYFEHGEKTYIEFRNERFLDKTKALSDVIKTVSLPSFESKSKESTKFKPSKENSNAKIQAIAQIAIALLITELEKHLLSTEYLFFAKKSQSKTSLVTDFMSLMRRIRFTNLQTFKESFEVMWKSILSVCEFNQLNIIYDSYITEQSNTVNGNDELFTLNR